MDIEPVTHWGEAFKRGYEKLCYELKTPGAKPLIERATK